MKKGSHRPLHKFDTINDELIFTVYVDVSKNYITPMLNYSTKYRQDKVLLNFKELVLCDYADGTVPLLFVTTVLRSLGSNIEIPTHLV